MPGLRDVLREWRLRRRAAPVFRAMNERAQASPVLELNMVRYELTRLIEAGGDPAKTLSKGAREETGEKISIRDHFIRVVCEFFDTDDLAISLAEFEVWDMDRWSDTQPDESPTEREERLARHRHGHEVIQGYFFEGDTTQT
jgi:hypothetical protein